MDGGWEEVRRKIIRQWSWRFHNLPERKPPYATTLVAGASIFVFSLSTVLFFHGQVLCLLPHNKLFWSNRISETGTRL